MNPSCDHSPQGATPSTCLTGYANSAASFWLFLNLVHAVGNLKG